MTSRLGWVACTSLLFAPPAFADTPSPLDLVRGLRENQLPDLALEYLAEIEAKSPAKDVLVVVPLERAKVQLVVAQTDPDEAVRDAALSSAKGQFQKFLREQAIHRARSVLVEKARGDVHGFGRSSGVRRRRGERPRRRAGRGRARIGGRGASCEWEEGLGVRRKRL